MRERKTFNHLKIALHGLDYKGWGWLVHPSLIIFPGCLISGYSDVRVLTPSGPSISPLVIMDETNELGCLIIDDKTLIKDAPVEFANGTPTYYVNAWADNKGGPMTTSAYLEAGQFYWGFSEEGVLLSYSWLNNGNHHQVDLEEWLQPLLNSLKGQMTPWVKERILDRPYRPTGMPLLIEEVIEAMGHLPRYCRTGRRAWLCEVGSAKMSLSYHEDPAIMTVELRLAGMGPETHLRELMIFLLRQNYSLPGYNFGIHQNAVYMALDIPARFISLEHTGPFLKGLLALSDQFDNQLVDQYKAVW